MKISLILVCCFSVAASGQSATARVTTAGDRDLLTRLVAAEDSRLDPADNDPRRLGLASANSYIRAFTVRGLGRMEHAGSFSLIAPALRDTSAEVRAAAPDAMAQSVARPGSGQAAATAPVRAALLERLSVEKDPVAIASLLESIGRLMQGSVDQLKASA